MLWWFLTLTVICGSCSTVNIGKGTPSKPNIVLIVADDLGFNELGYQNETRGLITPQLDELAISGIQLRNYYVQPICSPTRSALMTGRYPIRLGTQSNVINVFVPYGIPLENTFIPEIARDAGYTTAMFGKWHLGFFEEEYKPIHRGFDSYEGYLCGCGGYFNHIGHDCQAPTNAPSHKFCSTCGYDWDRQDTIYPPTNGTYSAWAIRDRAVNFIQNHTQQAPNTPFFLYLPFQNVHAPIEVPKNYSNLYPSLSGDPELQTLCGMITALDESVGIVMDELRRSGAYENTIIIFTSDNGAPGTADPNAHSRYSAVRNYPLRGWKTEIWEGGTRVAGFVHSPLIKTAPYKNEHLYHVTDWLPTLAHIMGVDITNKTLPLDGHNIWHSLISNSPSPRKEMLYNINPLTDGQAGYPKAAIRDEQYKLLVNFITNTTTSGDIYLFDLKNDPSETHNLASKMPEKVKQLTERLYLYYSGQIPPTTFSPPWAGKDYWCADCPKGTTSEPYHAWRPWVTKPKPPPVADKPANWGK